MAMCASATGIPISALKMAKKAGCVAFRHGRVDLGEFLKWFFAQAGDEETRDWTKESKKWEAKLRQIKVAEAEQSVIEFAEVRQFLNKLVGGLFFGELDRLAQEFPPRLKGKTEIAIHSEVAQEIEAIRATMRTTLQSWMTRGKKEAK